MIEPDRQKLRGMSTPSPGSSAVPANSATPRAAALGAQVALILFASFAIRLVDAGSPPVRHDELYSILAARSYISDGSFRIWHGEYVRAPAFTILVGWSMAAFGDTLFGARLPSIIAGALIVAASFLWLHRLAGATAAWTMAILLGLSSFAIDMSHFARFYTLHGLFFWLGAIAVYSFVVNPRKADSFIILGLGIVSLAAAYHLQQVTLIGSAALAFWALLDAGSRYHACGVSATRRARYLIAFIVLIFASVLALSETSRAFLYRLYEQYRSVELWNAGPQHNARFYVHSFAGNMPLFFYCFPIISLIALVRAPRPAFFCLSVCGVALLLHSFAGMKALRYVYYTYPFIFAICGIAAAVLIPPLFNAGATLWMRLRDGMTSTGSFKLGPHVPHDSWRLGGSGQLAAVAYLTLACVVALAGNPDFQSLRTLPPAVAAHVGFGDRASPWVAQNQSRDALRQLVDSRSLLITSNELQALYFFGRYDVLVRASRLDEVAPGEEFARDPRTGGPVVSLAESLRRVMACYPTGTMLVWGNDWRVSHAVSADVSDLIEYEMKEVKLPGNLQVRAFEWGHPASMELDCRRVHQALSLNNQPSADRADTTRPQ